MGACRVVQWSTGGVGSITVAAISSRPDLERVGLCVYSTEKVGRVRKAALPLRRLARHVHTVRGLRLRDGPQASVHDGTSRRADSDLGPPVRMVADRLGAELDGIRETHENGSPRGWSRSRQAPSRPGPWGGAIRVDRRRGRSRRDRGRTCQPDGCGHRPRFGPPRIAMRLTGSCSTGSPHLRAAARHRASVASRDDRHDDARRQRHPLRLRRGPGHRDSDRPAADDPHARLRHRSMRR